MESNLNKVALFFMPMKAIIKVAIADKEFTEDQKQILRRVTMVLIEHGMSACVVLKKKIKKRKILKLKAI